LSADHDRQKTPELDVYAQERATGPANDVPQLQQRDLLLWAANISQTIDVCFSGQKMEEGNADRKGNSSLGLQGKLVTNWERVGE
jgi:hypothetical protein